MYLLIHIQYQYQQYITLLNASGPNQIEFFRKINILLLLSKFPSIVIRLKLHYIRLSLIQLYNGLV